MKQSRVRTDSSEGVRASWNIIILAKVLPCGKSIEDLPGRPGDEDEKQVQGVLAHKVTNQRWMLDTPRDPWITAGASQYAEASGGADTRVPLSN